MLHAGPTTQTFPDVVRIQSVAWQTPSPEGAGRARTEPRIHSAEESPTASGRDEAIGSLRLGGGRYPASRVAPDDKHGSIPVQ